MLEILPALRIHFSSWGLLQVDADIEAVDWLIFVGVLVLWWVLQTWLLPRLGVPT